MNRTRAMKTRLARAWLCGLVTACAAAELPAADANAEVWFAPAIDEPALPATDWPVARGATALPDLTPPAVRLAADTPQSAQAAQLQSRVIPLARARGGRLSLAVWSESDRARANLRVEYRASDGRWRSLARLGAWDVGVAGAPRLVSWSLPAEALHERFAFRIRADVRGGTAWYVSGVSLAVDPRGLIVHVRSAPETGVPIEYSVGAPSAPNTMRTPFDVARDAAEDVTFLAPASALGGVFANWRFDNEVDAAPHRRWLTVTTDHDVTIEARYAPADAQTPALTAVMIDTEPAGLADLRLAPSRRSKAAVAVAGGEIECLAGESLTCRAPARVEGWVFERWVVDGVAIPDGDEEEITVVAGRRRSVIASYALLGDMNGDGRVDRDDVDVFIRAVADPEGYEAEYPELRRVARGDINGDGWLDGNDVEPFVRLFFEDEDE